MSTEFSGTIVCDSASFPYSYRVMNVARFSALNIEAQRVKTSTGVGTSRVFRSYIDSLCFALPEDFQEAKSLIVLAIAIPPLKIKMKYKGTEVYGDLPPNYYDAGLNNEKIREELIRTVLGGTKGRLERIDSLCHAKLIASRCGLVRYGRNNIAYAEGMGSYMTIQCFLTNCDLGPGEWHEHRALDECANCTLCSRLCPGGAIRPESFLINADRCLSLYNEVEGDFPPWAQAKDHHAIMGCMRCQEYCPANKATGIVAQVGAELTERETAALVEANPDLSTREILSKKLKIPWLAANPEYAAPLYRNVRALVMAAREKSD